MNLIQNRNILLSRARPQGAALLPPRGRLSHPRTARAFGGRAVAPASAAPRSHRQSRRGLLARRGPGYLGSGRGSWAERASERLSAPRSSCAHTAWPASGLWPRCGLCCPPGLPAKACRETGWGPPRQSALGPLKPHICVGKAKARRPHTLSSPTGGGGPWQGPSAPPAPPGRAPGQRGRSAAFPLCTRPVAGSLLSTQETADNTFTTEAAFRNQSEGARHPSEIGNLYPKPSKVRIVFSTVIAFL